MLARDPSNGRVLVYHEMQAPPFRAQLCKIARRFDFVDIGSAVERLQDGPPAGARRPFALLTFDDGCRDFFSVVDDLVRLEIPACLYITRDWLGHPGYMKPSDVRSISQAFEIGSHSVSHARLRGLDDRQLVMELAGSKQFLEDLLGRPVVHFAAPFGGPASFGAAALQGAADAGYETFRTTFRGWNRPASRDDGRIRLLRGDLLDDTFPSWRVRATLEGALDWRASHRLRRTLAG